jgi:hypothetical protein
VLARGTCQQHKELIFRAFSYNSRRMEALFLLFIEDFYKAACPRDLFEALKGRGMVILVQSARSTCMKAPKQAELQENNNIWAGGI